MQKADNSPQKNGVTSLVPCSVLTHCFFLLSTFPPLASSFPLITGSDFCDFSDTVSWSPRALASFPTHLSRPPASAFLARVPMWKEYEERIARSAWDPQMPDALQPSNRANGYPTECEENQSLGFSLLTTQSTNHLWKTTGQLTAHKLHYLLFQTALSPFYHRKAF